MDKCTNMFQNNYIMNSCDNTLHNNTYTVWEFPISSCLFMVVFLFMFMHLFSYIFSYVYSNMPTFFTVEYYDNNISSDQKFVANVEIVSDKFVSISDSINIGNMIMDDLEATTVYIKNTDPLTDPETQSRMLTIYFTNKYNGDHVYDGNPTLISNQIQHIISNYIENKQNILSNNDESDHDNNEEDDDEEYDENCEEDNDMNNNQEENHEENQEENHEDDNNEDDDDNVNNNQEENCDEDNNEEDDNNEDDNNEDDDDQSSVETTYSPYYIYIGIRSIESKNKLDKLIRNMMIDGGIFLKYKYNEPIMTRDIVLRNRANRLFFFNKRYISKNYLGKCFGLRTVTPL